MIEPIRHFDSLLGYVMKQCLDRDRFFKGLCVTGLHCEIHMFYVWRKDVGRKMSQQDHKAGKLYLLAIIVLLALAAFNLFYQLGSFPIYSWDEARHGVSAYEMLKNHNYIVNTYRGHADYWNLKPPLSFWAIIAGYKLAGFNALGLRMSSAVFALLTIIIVAGFTYKKYGKAASIISMLVLVTCTQYITNHAARTGDADSLFIFLFSVSVISLLQLDQNRKWLYVSGISFALAFLTKSWHAGNIAVIIALYLFLTRKYKQLTVQNWILFMMCLAAPIFIWGVIRFQYDGLRFFQGMVYYDLFHRSSTPIEGHVGGFSYYFLILSRFFIYWILVLGLLSVWFVFKRNGTFTFLKGQETIGIGLWVLIPFILFTFAKTKIRWYIMPVYPPLSILAGALASKLLQKGKWKQRMILLAAVLSVSLYYESGIISYLQHPALDLKQSLIDMTAKKGKVKNDPLFIYHPSGKAVWSQSDVLSAELVDNFHIKNGGYNKFLKSSKALLMIPKKWYSGTFTDTNHLKVISYNQWGYIVEKDYSPKRIS
jgi:4-amino-4-deoxy-L-arabinose transferase-like glycosyltransferase